MTDTHRSTQTLDAEAAKTKLDKVSPTFCLAKWKQVTIHLHNGMTHSCHHPSPHKIPLDELAVSPTALHNTIHKNKARREMLMGYQTPECGYCWNVENGQSGSFSDRHYKSGEQWARDDDRPITNDDPQFNINPSYVEVSFSNVCNFACSYCSPQVSSSWVEDVKYKGPYQLTDYGVHSLDWLKDQGMMPIPEREHNPYVEAFWKWWPDLYPSLKVLRITGGEPLLSKHTWRVLDYVDANPRPDLSIAINTNLGVPFSLIEKLVTYCNRMVAENKLRAVDIFTSLDTWGPQAAYIRDGMDWDAFLHNFYYVLNTMTWLPYRSKMTIMCTFNLFSIPGFKELLDNVLVWRRENADKDWIKLWLDIAYLRYPDWQIAPLVDDTHKAVLAEHLAFMEDNHHSGSRPWGFLDVEIDKLRRLNHWVQTPMDPASREKGLRNLHLFFTEYDRRRNLDRRATFPTLAGLFDEAESLVTQTP